MRGGNLAELCKGGRAIITDVESEGAMGRRLRDLGLIKGTEVMCVGKSPLGDPAAYLVRGVVIALRREDSSGIKICPAEVRR